MSKPSPAFLDYSQRLVEEAMRESRKVTFDAVLELCTDIAAFGGSASDCIIAITTFRRRIEESHH